MAKKKKAPQLEAWCWYCDREFEDDKVLLQHQKAKHYKCPYCPRRLNTAGGLTVHLHQVHKAEPTKIENALPGRESFDIEIYGMVGIPEADLAEWRARRAKSGASMDGGPAGQPGAKRQKVENVALTPEQLKAQLEAHKALMSGQAPPPGAAPPMFPNGHSMPPAGPPPFAAPYGQPPPFMPPNGYPAGPPPGFNSPYSGPPPPRPWGQYSGPPPNITPLPQLSPHQIAVRDGAKSRMVYTDQTLSPEEKLATSSKYAYIDPDDPPQSLHQPPLQQGPPAGPPPPGPWQQGPASYQQGQHDVGGYYNRPPPPWAPAPPPAAAFSPNHGATSPYAGPPPNAMAGTPPYPPPRPPPGFAGSPPPGVPPPRFAGPPPGAPYSGPPPNYAGSPHQPPPGLSPPHVQHSGPPPPVAGASSPPPAQSYPAVPPNASPPAARPEAHTAEALAKANVSTAAPGEAANRENAMAHMEGKAEAEHAKDAEVGEPVAQPSSSPSGGAPRSAAGRRAKAADLF